MLPPTSGKKSWTVVRRPLKSMGLGHTESRAAGWKLLLRCAGLGASTALKASWGVPGPEVFTAPHMVSGESGNSHSTDSLSWEVLEGMTDARPTSFSKPFFFFFFFKYSFSWRVSNLGLDFKFLATKSDCWVRPQPHLFILVSVPWCLPDVPTHPLWVMRLFP